MGRRGEEKPLVIGENGRHLRRMVWGEYVGTGDQNEYFQSPYISLFMTLGLAVVLLPNMPQEVGRFCGFWRTKFKVPLHPHSWVGGEGALVDFCSNGHRLH